MKIITIVILVLIVFGIVIYINKNEQALSGNISSYQTWVYENEGSSKNLLYRFFEPSNVGKGETLPLLLYLHGGGSRGDNNISQLEFGPRYFSKPVFQNKYRSFILVPQCPKGTQWLNTACTNIPLKNYVQKEIPESDEMHMIVKLLRQIIKKYPVDNRRIYVTGVSMGGSGTWDIISRYPNLFAAAVTVNGVSDPSIAQTIRNLPIWSFHGKNDQISEVANTRKMIDALKQVGSLCKYTEFPNKGHDIEEVVYGDMKIYEWLYAQHKE